MDKNNCGVSVSTISEEEKVLLHCYENLDRMGKDDLDRVNQSLAFWGDTHKICE